MGLKIVIIAKTKPPSAEASKAPPASRPSATAFQDQSAVADRIAKSRNVLPTVPWTVIAMLRGFP